MKTNKRYGWKPDAPDFRDFYLDTKSLEAKLYPDTTDLRSGFEAPYDQKNLGSCTANAIAGAIQFARKKQHELDFIPSRLFVYYNERSMEGTVDQDSGAAIRDGIKSVNVQGVCPEKTWPYNIKKFTVKPTPAAYKSALLCQTLKYQRINQTLNDMCLCLFNGFPIVLGFTVYESFESDAVAQTGIAPMPQKSEKVLGGHAVCCVGYDLTAQTWICRNSWGTGWGMNGYFTLQQEYLLHPDLACDFWTITLTE